MLYGSPGVGNVLHLAAEAFAQKAGVTMQHVPYKGSSEVMTALLGGSVQVMFVTPVSVVGLVKEGRVRALFAMREERAARRAQRERSTTHRHPERSEG